MDHWQKSQDASSSQNVTICNIYMTVLRGGAVQSSIYLPFTVLPMRGPGVGVIVTIVATFQTQERAAGFLPCAVWERSRRYTGKFNQNVTIR